MADSKEESNLSLDDKKILNRSKFYQPYIIINSFYIGDHSIKEEYFKVNIENLNQSIDGTFKDFNSQIFNHINVAFNNFNSNYEKRVRKLY